MLDNVMLYWLTGTGASSARLYWESLGSIDTTGRVELPTGIACFPKEIMLTPRRWCEADTTSHAGPPCREAVTSLRSNNQSSSLKT